MPKISVILTSFNHEKYIREAIESVLAQTFIDFELIIWDDASTDQSWNIINSYSDSRIKAYRNEVNQRYVINRAVTEVASGQYIAIHHSDDIWEKDKLEKQLEFLETHLEFGAVFTQVQVIDENSEPFYKSGHFYSDIFEQPNRTRHEWLNHFFYRYNALCHPSVLIRKQCYEVCGLYRYGLALLPDFDMWIRLCLKYEIYVLPEKLTHFRVRDNEANTSGDRPETRIRGATEYHLLLRNFIHIETFEEMVAIFPEAKSYYRVNGFEVTFVFAMICLEGQSAYPSKLFAIELLFDLISDKNKAVKIKELYNFDYLDFIALTGKHNLFPIDAAETLDRILTSRSWKITAPLRKLSNFLAAYKTTLTN